MNLGFDEKLISKFTEIIKPALDVFIQTLMSISSSSIPYNDYMRYYSILNAVVSLLEWITVDSLYKILQLNGELDG